MANAGQGGVYDQSASAMQGAVTGTQNAMAGPDMAQFQNPYQSQVTDQTLADLERQRQMQMNTLGAQAGAAGAFGGSRHGVAESLTNEGFARTGADTLANLNSQGFNTALGAAQNQQNIGLQGSSQLGQLGQAGFNMGNTINQQQLAAGSMQQGMQQALIDAAKAQYSGWAGAPEQSLNLPLAALGSANMGQGSQTTTQQPGLMNYLSMGMGLL